MLISASFGSPRVQLATHAGIFKPKGMGQSDFKHKGMGQSAFKPKGMGPFCKPCAKLDTVTLKSDQSPIPLWEKCI